MKICVQTVIGLIRWKMASTASIFQKMEDALNFFKNRRQPQFSIFSKMEYELNFLKNGRRPRFFSKMEHDFNFFKNGR